MKIERSTVDQVKNRFAMNKKKLEEKKKQYDFEERMKELKEEEEKSRAYKKEKKKEMKKRKTQDDTAAAPADDMAAIMGFAGFGGSAKNQNKLFRHSWKQKKINSTMKFCYYFGNLKLFVILSFIIQCKLLVLIIKSKNMFGNI